MALGYAKTDKFMLGTAEVMLGTPENVFSLDADQHSIGLVKNFTISANPEYTELTQGRTNRIVYSVVTGNTVSAAMEVYEYTDKNIQYALGLGETTPRSAHTTYLLAYTTAEGSDAANNNGDSPLNVEVNDLGSGQDILRKNEWVKITKGKQTVLRYITNVDPNNSTIIVNAALPFDVSATDVTNESVALERINPIGVGQRKVQPFLGAKVIGTLANDEYVTLIFPKIRVTSSFSMAFTTNDYGNLPFEFTVYDMLDSDTDHEIFEKYGQALLARGKY